jgi:hypothetical protein
MLKDQIIEEATRRIEAGEDIDPVCILAEELKAGTKVPESTQEMIWRLHNHGQWEICVTVELEIFIKYCNQTPNPFSVSEPVLICGIPVYRGDYGDCVLREAALGHNFAVWTRKGRVYVGFRFEQDATAFRNSNKEYSLHKTGNRHNKLVVLEGWEWKVDDVAQDLNELGYWFAPSQVSCRIRPA